MVWRACSPIALAIALDELEAKRQGVAILARGGERLGKLEFQLQVIGVGRQGRSGRLERDAAGLLDLEPQCQLGLELLGLGLEITPRSRLTICAWASSSRPARARSAPAPGAPPAGPGRTRGPNCTWPRQPSDRSPPVPRHARRSVRPARARAGRATPGSPTRTCNPTKPSTALPSRTPKTAGIDRTPNCAASSGSRSVSTLASTNLPSYSCRQLLQKRAELAAWAAPRGPEVDHDRHRIAIARPRPAGSSAASARSRTRTSYSCRSSVRNSSRRPGPGHPDRRLTRCPSGSHRTVLALKSDAIP